MQAADAYAVVKWLHIGLGAVALAGFWGAGLSRKGGALHRRAGRAFLLAMAGILVTGVPMAGYALHRGQPFTALFLAYLLVIAATGVWAGWRAIADQGDVRAYTGPVFVALAVASFAGGAAMLALGLIKGQPLPIGFSAIGLGIGASMLRKRLNRDALAARPRWWMSEHYNAMIGNGVAVHIAFLGIGLPRLLPMLGGATLQQLVWFGPLALALAAKLWVDRRRRAPAPQHIGARKESAQR